MTVSKHNLHTKVTSGSATVERKSQHILWLYNFLIISKAFETKYKKMLNLEFQLFETTFLAICSLLTYRYSELRLETIEENMGQY